MRIAYDHQIFSVQVFGGVSRYFGQLAKHMSSLDNTEAKIIAPFYVNGYLGDLKSSVVSGHHVSRTPIGTSKFLGLVNSMASRPEIRKFDPDVVHETWYSDKPLSGERPSVVTIFDMIHERLPDYFPRNDATSAVKRRAVERADQVICISENTRLDLLAAWDVAPEKVTAIHLGFDAARMTALPGPAIVNQPYLLHVGVGSGYKNFARFLDAFLCSSRLRNEFAIVCFGGSHPDGADASRLVAEGKLLWRKGDDATLTRLYRDASALVYPSLYEGFGIPPLEAMANDCPVVCSTGGSIPEVVSDAGEYFDPEDTQAIAAAIERVVLSETRSTELRAAGQRRLRDFSWNRCAAETRRVYARIA